MNENNPSGMMNGMPPIGKPEKKIGPIIGVLVIVLLLIISALYFFGSRLNSTETKTMNSEKSDTAMVEEKTMPIRNEGFTETKTGDASLEADLDAELKDVDYSF